MAKRIMKNNSTNNTPHPEEIISKSNGWERFIPILKKRSWVIILLLVVVTGVIWIISNNQRSQQKVLESLQTVQVVKGDLIAIVGATGTVTANQSANLSWQTNGRIAVINVKVNDRVQKGDVLSQLETTSMAQNIIAARADLVTAQRNLETAIESKTERASKYLDLLRAEEDLKQAEKDRDRWNYKNADMNRIYEARDTFLDAEDDLQDDKLSLDELAEESLDDPEYQTAKATVDEKQLARDKALRNLNYILGKNYDDDVAEDFAEYDLAKAKVEDARREWERVKDGQNEDDIDATQARVDALEATISLGEITAPFTGVVTEVNSKIGDEVTTGTKSFRIDDLSKLIVIVDIPEVDINSIRVGQRAELIFDAILGKTYAGKVTEVASVGNDISGTVYFTVKVELINADQQVRPGMTAAVNLVVNEVKEALTVPNRAIRQENGKRIVYLLRNGALTPIEVEIGASSDTETQVLSGDLQVDDIVVLNPPFQIPTNGRPPSFVTR